MLTGDDMVWMRDMAVRLDREFRGKNMTPRTMAAISDRIHREFQERFVGIYVPKITFEADGTMRFEAENAIGRGDIRIDPAERDRILGLDRPSPKPAPVIPTPVETRIIDGEVFVKASDVLRSLSTWQIPPNFMNGEVVGYWQAVADVQWYMRARIKRAAG